MVCPLLEPEFVTCGVGYVSNLELLVILRKSVLTSLTSDCGLSCHSAVISGFCVTPFFPDHSLSISGSRGQGKAACLKDSFFLLLGIKCSPKTTLWSLPQGNEQFEPWTLWANTGTTKSWNHCGMQRSGISVYLFQGVSMTERTLCKKLCAFM